MFSPENLPDKVKYISLLTAANYSGFYSQEYLSLRARQGKLKAVKVGRNWVTTKSWVDDYIHNDRNFRATNGKEPKVIFAVQQEIKQEILTKDSVVFQPSFKKRKKVFSLVSILVVFGLVVGGLFLKPDIPRINFLTQNKEIQNIKKQTNDYIVGFSLFIKSGLVKFKKGIWETRIFLVYFSNRVNDSLDFSSKPWGKEAELLVDSNTTLGSKKGMIVIPSQGETQDEKTKAKIRESFSDEIEVELKDADSGVITPIFKEKKGDGYMYLMVPVKN